MNVQCLKCKGRNFCGRTPCPHLLKAEAMYKVQKQITSTDFSSQSPAPFVGRYGYPFVNVGILAPPNSVPDAWRYDAPGFWAEKNYSIPSIMELRGALVNSRSRARITEQNRFLDIGKEVGMAQNPVDIEIQLQDKPRFRLSSNSDTAPMGPYGNLKKARVTSNPKVHSKVEKTVSDTDQKAGNALVYLYENRFDENFLTRILSVGNLGIKKNRKLVPTRWSITAVDDTISKHLYGKIRHYHAASDHMAFFGGYLGNFYLIMMIPDVWSYELFETYMPKASWNTSSELSFTTDYELYYGRKDYAENCAGGYYSVRLSVLEKLKELRRQASCLVIRVITGDYAVPLGVWVTREAARKALSAKPIRFSSLELMLRYARALTKNKFGYEANLILDQSKVLKTMKKQQKLSNFL